MALSRPMSPLALLALWSATAAGAAVTPGPYGTLITAAADGSGFESAGAFGLVTKSNATLVATARSGTGPAPFVDAVATSVGASPTLFARAAAELGYHWQAVGPASAQPIPVLMTALGEIQALGSQVVAYAHYTVSTFGQLLFDERLCLSYQAVGPDGLPCNTSSTTDWVHDKAPFGALVDRDYFVGMNVLANAAAGGTAIAAIDPVFVIDPSFADAALYHIEFSPGIRQTDPGGGGGGGGIAIDEPAPLALLAAALLPWLRLRRR